MEDLTPRLLQGVLALREFSAAELAAHAGARVETARQFLNRHPDIVETVGRNATLEGVGRPRSRWRLRAKGEEALVNRLRSLADALTSTAFGSTEERLPIASLDALEESLKALTDGSIRDPEEYKRELQIAKIQLSVSEAALKDRREYCDVQSHLDTMRLDQARHMVMRLPDEISEGLADTTRIDEITNKIRRQWLSAIDNMVSRYGEWLRTSCTVSGTSGVCFVIDYLGENNSHLKRALIYQAKKSPKDAIAYFSADKYTQETRCELLSLLHDNISTPAAAGARLVVTVNGKSSIAKRVVKEIIDKEKANRIYQSPQPNDEFESLCKEAYRMAEANATLQLSGMCVSLLSKQAVNVPITVLDITRSTVIQRMAARFAYARYIPQARQKAFARVLVHEKS